MVVSPASRQLKQLRKQANLSIREVAHALGMEYGSSYQHYEDRFKKPFLPLELVIRLIPIFGRGGIHSKDMYALAGLDSSGELSLPSEISNDAKQIDDGRVRIEEIDLRTTTNLKSKSEKTLTTWNLPSSFLQGYRATSSKELRIVTVIGDSMEPTLRAGQWLLIDIADCMPSPPGVFVLRDGHGLAINRVQIVPQSQPLRVRISCENPKYEAHESTLENAYIQGRVIGQWRWL
ncbi:MAG: S24 family peptidase [Stellaceae bacterium]|jgi:hypothetical protein